MADVTPRSRRHHAWRALGLVVVLALFAFALAFTFAAARGEAPSSGPAPPDRTSHDASSRLGHDHRRDTPAVHALRSQPASRSRPSVFAVLAVGVIVAALARRTLLTGARAVARASGRAGLRPGRGPPLARIA